MSSTAAALWCLRLCTLYIAWRLHKSLWDEKDSRPLQWAVGLLTSAFFGIASSIAPNIGAIHDSVLLPLAGIGLVIILLLVLQYWTASSRGPEEPVSRAVVHAAPVPHMSARRTSSQPNDLHLS